MLSNIDSLNVIFDNMSKEGWNIHSNLKWGFFFVDSSRDKLTTLYSELEGHGYILDNIHLAEDGKWVLHTSKIDTLTPEKLYRRNLAFNELADYCDVELYDGWDVEQIV